MSKQRRPNHCGTPKSFSAGRLSAAFTWHYHRPVLVQPLKEVLLEGVVVEGPVDVGGADGGVGHADLGEVGLALELPLVPALGVRGILLLGSID